MKGVYRFFFSDRRICEIGGNSELDARIKVLRFVKDYGGIPYTGMIEAQRPHVIRDREIFITHSEYIPGVSSVEDLVQAAIDSGEFK